MCESPAERDFLCAAYGHIEGLIPQHSVPGYRLDFAVPDKQIAIEIDGHEYHKTKEQRTHDAKRERELSIAGWRVVRSASEIFQNAPSCVADVLRLIGDIDTTADASAWEKGLDLCVQHKYGEAIQAYDKAVELDPKFAPAWIGKGNTLCFQGKSSL